MAQPETQRGRQIQEHSDRDRIAYFDNLLSVLSKIVDFGYKSAVSCRLAGELLDEVKSSRTQGNREQLNTYITMKYRNGQALTVFALRGIEILNGANAVPNLRTYLEEELPIALDEHTANRISCTRQWILHDDNYLDKTAALENIFEHFATDAACYTALFGPLDNSPQDANNTAQNTIRQSTNDMLAVFGLAHDILYVTKSHENLMRNNYPAVTEPDESSRGQAASEEQLGTQLLSPFYRQWLKALRTEGKEFSCLFEAASIGLFPSRTSARAAELRVRTMMRLIIQWRMYYRVLYGGFNQVDYLSRLLTAAHRYMPVTMNFVQVLADELGTDIYTFRRSNDVDRKLRCDSAYSHDPYDLRISGSRHPRIILAQYEHITRNNNTASHVIPLVPKPPRTVADLPPHFFHFERSRNQGDKEVGGILNSKLWRRSRSQSRFSRPGREPNRGAIEDRIRILETSSTVNVDHKIQVDPSPDELKTISNADNKEAQSPSVTPDFQKLSEGLPALVLRLTKTNASEAMLSDDDWVAYSACFEVLPDLFPQLGPNLQEQVTVLPNDMSVYGRSTSTMLTIYDKLQLLIAEYRDNQAISAILQRSSNHLMSEILRLEFSRSSNEAVSGSAAGQSKSQLEQYFQTASDLQRLRESIEQAAAMPIDECFEMLSTVFHEITNKSAKLCSALRQASQSRNSLREAAEVLWKLDEVSSLLEKTVAKTIEDRLRDCQNESSEEAMEAKDAVSEFVAAHLGTPSDFDCPDLSEIDSTAGQEIRAQDISPRRDTTEEIRRLRISDEATFLNDDFADIQSNSGLVSNSGFNRSAPVESSDLLHRSPLLDDELFASSQGQPADFAVFRDRAISSSDLDEV